MDSIHLEKKYFYIIIGQTVDKIVKHNNIFVVEYVFMTRGSTDNFTSIITY